MKTAIKRTTTINATNLPKGWRNWNVKDYLQKTESARGWVNVDYLEGDDDTLGYQFTYDRHLTDSEFAEEKAEIERALQVGIEYSNAKEKDYKQKQRDFVANFEFRDLGDAPKEAMANAAWLDVFRLQKGAKESLKAAKIDEDKYFAIFDVPAYYEVLDAALTGNKKKTVQALSSQDTAVRECFDRLYQYLEDKGLY